MYYVYEKFVFLHNIIFVCLQILGKPCDGFGKKMCGMESEIWSVTKVLESEVCRVPKRG